MINEQTIKLKLKTAQVEIEYEGSEIFLRSDLLRIITEIAEAHKSNPPIETANQQVPDMELDSTPSSGTDFKSSVRSIATTLNVKSGPDLILATCAYLTLVAKRDTFGRNDILQEMKKAANFYKKSYNNNFSNSLVRLLLDKKIHEQEKNILALPDQIRNDMEIKLGIHR